ncbi:MAG TPA: trehalose-phosphatase [Candidatus Eisenbacteria bacterium]|nr:trehalose-phosphatase [Candidatus Eisenbacteria bacterium]
MSRSLFAHRVWERLHDTLRSRAAILVALDLDGTLAPIVGRPERARVLPRILPLLAKGARRRRTRIAIVSARPASAIRRLVPIAGVQRVGQYGLEGPFAPPAERRRTLHRAADALAILAESGVEPIAGAWVERKRLTVAIHGRAVPPVHRPALDRVVHRLARDARRLGFRPQIGRRVVDFVPAGFDKGTALLEIIRAHRPDVTLYFGDSPSDERAFRALGPDDFPIRVGAGATAAPFRVGGPGDVARVLSAVVRLRADSASHPRR